MALATLLSPAVQQSQAPANSWGSVGNIGSAMGAVGGIFAALGAVQAAKTQRQNIRFQSEVADLNAQHARFVGDINSRISELGAQSILNQGEHQAAAVTLRAGQIKSTQRANMAANGIDLGVGNAAEVLASTDIMKEIDKNTVEANAVRSAWGYRAQGLASRMATDQQASNFQTQSDFARTTANSINPNSAGVSSLLSSAGDVAKAWYKNSKVS